ncbi:MAG TPA: hypothetical protein VMO26_08315 [Vicinamibacterales bacterium]|nr:hypothetical protein [Vicinamibacterales bacterium]
MWATCLAVLVLLCIITWPLAAQLGQSLPGDYGDPLFVTWVMGWVNGRIIDGAFQGFWDANIFFPERHTLAYSESFIGQSLMVLPVYWFTQNAILSYNVAFILTFVLTGASTFLFTRALVGSVVGAMVAVIVATFNEYRLVWSLAHLHTLSLHWWLFALFSLHRYFVTDRRRYLVATAASLVALHLSSVYYTAYCAPLFVVFALAEAIRSGRWRTGRVWLELWATAAVVTISISPFLLPYMAVQQRLGVERSIAELNAATLDHWAAVLPGLSAPLVLAPIGLVGAVFIHRLRYAMALTLVMLALAFWLSLGVEVRRGGVVLDWPGLYTVLYRYVPGFTALGVPHRYASMVFLFSGVATAIGLAAIEWRSRRAAQVVAVLALLVFLKHSVPSPIMLNFAWPSPDLVNPAPAYLTPHNALPTIYQAVDSLRPTAVLAELPFGDHWYDLRYMYFSAMHRRQLLNGYSGIFPPSYLARQRVLARPLLDPGASAQALAGATHVVVHRAAWTDDTGARVSAWLEQFGATLIAEADEAALYELPVRENYAKRRLRRDVRSRRRDPR